MYCLVTSSGSRCLHCGVGFAWEAHGLWHSTGVTEVGVSGTMMGVKGGRHTGMANVFGGSGQRRAASLLQAALPLLRAPDDCSGLGASWNHGRLGRGDRNVSKFWVKVEVMMGSGRGRWGLR